MENTFKLTAEGVTELKKDLEILKTKDRLENLEALKEARAQGDLSENADYDAARDEQARIESKIKEIENILKHVEIIRHDATNIANIGKTITIKFSNTGIINTYNVVGSIEADPLNGKISNESPIGKGLIGNKVGDVLDIKTETGKEIKIEILEVK